MGMMKTLTEAFRRLNRRFDFSSQNREDARRARARKGKRPRKRRK